MSHRVTAVLAAAVVLAVAEPASAQVRRGTGDWSILGAETVAPGQDVLHGAFGWPDVTFGYTHGMNPNFDLGLRFQLVYGVENTTNSHFGIAAAVPMRWSIAHRGNVGLLVHVDPGLRLYTTDPALFGFQFPIGLNLEFPTHSQMKVGVGADFNMSLFVTGPFAPRFFFGPLVGPYFEYHIDPTLAVGVDTRFGAIIDAFSTDTRFFRSGGGTDTNFGFRAQLMLAYRP